MLKIVYATIKFSYLNAAGTAIDGNVRYAIASYKSKTPSFSKYTTVEANKVVDLKPLQSGHYMLQAICEQRYIRARNLLYSTMDDKRPVIETHDWFYIK